MLLERIYDEDLAQASYVVIAICRSGKRSGVATRVLTSAGFACDNMAGGMLAWQSAGLPTV